MPVVYHKVQFKAPFYFPSSYSHLARVCERIFLIAVQMTRTYTSRVDTWWCKKPRFTEIKATICQAIKGEFSSNTLRWLRERISANPEFWWMLAHIQVFLAAPLPPSFPAALLYSPDFNLMLFSKMEFKISFGTVEEIQVPEVLTKWAKEQRIHPQCD